MHNENPVFCAIYLRRLKGPKIGDRNQKSKYLIRLKLYIFELGCFYIFDTISLMSYNHTWHRYIYAQSRSFLKTLESESRGLIHFLVFNIYDLRGISMIMEAIYILKFFFVILFQKDPKQVTEI